MSIFVTRPVPGPGIPILREALGEGNVLVYPYDRAMQRAELLASVRGVAGLLTMLNDNVDAKLMDAAGPGLKVVANYAVGYNNIDIAEATRRGIAVINTPDVLTQATADIAWALLMAAARRLTVAERFVRSGAWTGWGPGQFLGMELHGKTLGIFGMGRIGEAVAERAKGFRIRVLYTKRSQLTPERETELNATFVSKEQLVAESDFISIHCPLTPETRHAFGAPEFAAMKPSACLVNTSRGPVVDEAALIEALKSGRIFAAGLDVYEDEPAIHPDLLKCEAAVILPHIGSATFEARGRMSLMAARDLVAVLRGERPENCVNPEVLG